MSKNVNPHPRKIPIPKKSRGQKSPKNTRGWGILSPGFLPNPGDICEIPGIYIPIPGDFYPRDFLGMGIFRGWGFIFVGWGYPSKKPPLLCIYRLNSNLTLISSTWETTFHLSGYFTLSVCTPLLICSDIVLVPTPRSRNISRSKCLLFLKKSNESKPTKISRIITQHTKKINFHAFSYPA